VLICGEWSVKEKSAKISEICGKHYGVRDAWCGILWSGFSSIKTKTICENQRNQRETLRGARCGIRRSVVGILVVKAVKICANLC